MGKPKTYPLEEALEGQVKEISRWIKMVKMFFFRIPKNKTEAHIYMVTVSPWLFFIFALVWAVSR